MMQIMHSESTPKTQNNDFNSCCLVINFPVIVRSSIHGNTHLYVCIHQFNTDHQVYTDSHCTIRIYQPALTTYRHHYHPLPHMNITNTTA